MSKEMEEFLKDIQIPCDFCGEMMCDGFCTNSKQIIKPEEKETK